MRPFGRSTGMSTIIRFPLSRTAAGRSMCNTPPRQRWQTDPSGARVVILPVVRIERHDAGGTGRMGGGKVICIPFGLETEGPRPA